MKQKEMIEMIQQEHADIGETQIRAMLNRAMDKFDEDTKGLSQYDNAEGLNAECVGGTSVLR